MSHIQAIDKSSSGVSSSDAILRNTGFLERQKLSWEVSEQLSLPACRSCLSSQLHRPALETSKVSADASPISFSNFSCQKSRVSSTFSRKNLNKSGKNLALNIQVFWGVANFAWLIGANVQNFIWGFRSFFFVLILCILIALFSTNTWLFCLSFDCLVKLTWFYTI